MTNNRLGRVAWGVRMCMESESGVD